MRKKLGKIDNERATFSGIFNRFGRKSGYKGGFKLTILLSNIKSCDDIKDIKKGDIITDHLWFNFTKRFRKLEEENELQTGDLIKFDARVSGYMKGYEKDYFDYKLSYPSKISKIGHIERFNELSLEEINTLNKESREIKENFNKPHLSSEPVNYFQKNRVEERIEEKKNLDAFF